MGAASNEAQALEPVFVHLPHQFYYYLPSQYLDDSLLATLIRQRFMEYRRMFSMLKSDGWYALLVPRLERATDGELGTR